MAAYINHFHESILNELQADLVRHINPLEILDYMGNKVSEGPRQKIQRECANSGDMAGSRELLAVIRRCYPDAFIRFVEAVFQTTTGDARWELTQKMYDGVPEEYRGKFSEDFIEAMKTRSSRVPPTNEEAESSTNQLSSPVPKGSNSGLGSPDSLHNPSLPFDRNSAQNIRERLPQRNSDLSIEDNTADETDISLEDDTAKETDLSLEDNTAKVRNLSLEDNTANLANFSIEDNTATERPSTEGNNDERKLKYLPCDLGDELNKINIGKKTWDEVCKKTRVSIVDKKKIKSSETPFEDLLECLAGTNCSVGDLKRAFAETSCPIDVRRNINSILDSCASTSGAVGGADTKINNRPQDSLQGLATGQLSLRDSPQVPYYQTDFNRSQSNQLPASQQNLPVHRQISEPVHRGQQTVSLPGCVVDKSKQGDSLPPQVSSSSPSPFSRGYAPFSSVPNTTPPDSEKGGNQQPETDKWKNSEGLGLEAALSSSTSSDKAEATFPDSIQESSDPQIEGAAAGEAQASTPRPAEENIQLVERQNTEPETGQTQEPLDDPLGERAGKNTSIEAAKTREDISAATHMGEDALSASRSCPAVGDQLNQHAAKPPDVEQRRLREDRRREELAQGEHFSGFMDINVGGLQRAPANTWIACQNSGSDTGLLETERQGSRLAEACQGDATHVCSAEGQGLSGDIPPSVMAEPVGETTGSEDVRQQGGSFSASQLEYQSEPATRQSSSTQAECQSRSSDPINGPSSQSENQREIPGTTDTFTTAESQSEASYPVEIPSRQANNHIETNATVSSTQEEPSDMNTVSESVSTPSLRIEEVSLAAAENQSEIPESVSAPETPGSEAPAPYMHTDKIGLFDSSGSLSGPDGLGVPTDGLGVPTDGLGVPSNSGEVAENSGDDGTTSVKNNTQNMGGETTSIDENCTDNRGGSDVD